jgi:GT2 family glycosyltransferase
MARENLNSRERMHLAGGLEVSVVMPTCNRLAMLGRSLDGLARQDLGLNRFEVIVVADRAEDGTAEFLSGYRGPLRLSWEKQSGLGAGPARNRGAALASARLLLFLDDDVEASESLVRTHLQAAAESQVCLGSLSTVIPQPCGWLGTGMRNWWERKFREMRQPGHRFDYTDLLSGHFSISKELFDRVGGFDPGFPCREDYELGVRLMKAGARFRFLDRAQAFHHETPDLRKNLRRSMSEGSSDVRLARRHPEVMPGLAATRYFRGGERAMRRMRSRAELSERWALLVERTLPLLEKAGFRGSWRRCFLGLRRYWYLRGVRSESPDWPGLERLFAENVLGRVETMSLDLGQGLERAEAQIERRSPAAVEVLLGDYQVGTIAAAPAGEPVRGPHLRAFLRETKGYELLVAMAWQELVNKPNDRQ